MEEQVKMSIMPANGNVSSYRKLDFSALHMP